MPKSVVIAGGGLAGLACGLSLARAGFEVRIYEASERLGGKAGARASDPRRDSFPHPIEHGPHFFPGWYHNVRNLMRTVGCLDHLVDFDDLYYVMEPPAGGGAPRTLRIPLGPRNLRELISGQVHTFLKGPLPWYAMMQSALSALDLITARFDGSRTLGDVSLAAFLRSRWYADEELALLLHNQVLRGSSISGHLVSARTIQTLLRLWFRYPAPFISVLDRDLQSGLIGPLGRALGERVAVRLEAPAEGLVVRGGEIAGLRLAGGRQAAADYTVVAVPVEVARRWVDDEVFRYDPELGRLSSLDTAPMAALHVAFREHLPGIPPGMVYLWGSPTSLNFIDLSQAWSDLRRGSAGRPPATVLSLVSSSFKPLAGLSEEAQIDVLLSELSRYFPAAERRLVAGTALQANLEHPLFVNTVGSWPDRPDAAGAPYGPRRPGNRLYLTGDYARNGADLACMESAVLAGLETAAALARAAAVEPGVPPIPLTPHGAGRALAYRLAKLLLVPGALAARLRSAGRGRRGLG